MLPQWFFDLSHEADVGYNLIADAIIALIQRHAREREHMRIIHTLI